MKQQLDIFDKQVTIDELIDSDALFVINHSGGKDSQAMYLHLQTIVPSDQIIVVHADLPGVDWDGSITHINNTIDHELHVVKSKKTFFEMVRKRGMFPGPQYRQCTSDLKRDPITGFLRRYSSTTGKKLIVNCMGIRAQESTARAKKDPFKQNIRNSKNGRVWYDWYPIFNWTTKQVFDYIKENGQKPFWTYGQGMQRKSCRFCIMACESDIQIASQLAPEAFKKITDLEEEIGFTMFEGKTLNQIANKAKIKCA